MKEHYQGTKRCRVDKRTEAETRQEGGMDAVPLTDTRGSSNSPYTQILYNINSVCILDVLHIALKYRIIFKNTVHCSRTRGYTA